MTAVASLSQAELLTGTPGAALRGSIAVPGDKSISHRALILGGLAQGMTLVEGLLEGDDVLRTLDAVRAFGARVERSGSGGWAVTGAPWSSPERPIDCGNSGTGARLLMGAAAGFPIEARFTGDASLSGRPMERVLEPLRRMGAKTQSAPGGRMPLTIRGGSLGGIRYLNEKASAQVKSAILLAGLQTDAPVEVIEPLRSRDHTENMLRAFGCDVVVDGDIIRLGADRGLRATPVQVPGDPSSAAFPIVAALITPDSDVTVRSVMINPLRAGLFETLREMGADIAFENRRSLGAEPVADIRARFGPMRAVEVAAARAPSMIDEFPILAVAAAFAEGTSIFRGLAELKVKESDRLAAIVDGLRACCVEARDEGDTLIVEGSGGAPRGGALVAAHHDHRIAMSFLVLGLAADRPVSVDSAPMIATSFPGFVDLMGAIGGRIG